MEKFHSFYSSEPSKDDTQPQEQPDSPALPPSDESELTDPREWLREDR